MHHRGSKLDNLPAIKQHLAATTDRYLAQQAELLDSTVDRGALAALPPGDDRDAPPPRHQAA